MQAQLPGKFYTRPTDFIIFFFFNDTATTEIYTLSLHDALPISVGEPRRITAETERDISNFFWKGDRKSTRLNSSHGYISYAVFCLKKKKKDTTNTVPNVSSMRDSY